MIKLLSVAFHFKRVEFDIPDIYKLGGVSKLRPSGN
jgi:hypothetical protein